MGFANVRLVKSIVAAVAFCVAEHVLFLADGAVAGRVFGSSALGAMMLIFPAFSFITLTSVAFAFCVAYFRQLAIERSDRSAAVRLVHLGFGGALVAGFVILGFATLIEYPYLDFLSPSEETLRHFDDYWGWFSLVVLFKTVGCVLLCFVYADGARRLSILAYFVHFFANPILSYAFCTGAFGLNGFGMEGVSFGAVVAYGIGTLILCRHFFDRKGCKIRFRVLNPVDDRSHVPVACQYEVLRGSQMTLDDLDGVIELDRLSLDSCYQVSANDDYALFKDNPENGLIIRDRVSGEIVGYSMLLPIRQDMYEKIKSGTFVDTDFKPEMTFKYGEPGIYHLYFASIVVHPDHRSAALVLTMLDAMVEDFIRLATKRGIWFSDMIADVVSNDGAKFCRLFGLKKVCETNHNSFIYEVSGLPPGIRETTPATKELVRIYRSKYETL